MSQQSRSQITLLVVGIDKGSALREFVDALSAHNFLIHYQSDPPPQDDTGHADPALCNLALFPLNSSIPGEITKLWRDARLPAAAITDNPHTCEQCAECDPVFAVISPKTDPATAATMLSIAAARGQSHADAVKRLVQLERTLEGRRAVEEAKWRLIEERAITEPEAHLLLQRAARGQRLPLPEVAQRFLDTSELPENSPNA
jgi:hypothetical protein